MADLAIPDLETIRDQILQDLELAAIDAGVAEPPIQPGSDWYALATAEANIHGIGLQSIALAQRDITPLEAQEPKLDEWRQAFGLPVIPAEYARGYIVVGTTGSATIVGGAQLTHATGQTYAAVATTVGVQNNDEIEVVALVAGEAGNLAAGAALQFVSAPANVKTRAVVSDSVPIDGGTDDESPEDKRDRILNSAANAPAGGNWGQLRELALEASPAVQDAYVYPALGGPSSAKVVVTRKFDPSRRIFTREPSSLIVGQVRTAIQSHSSDGQAVVVQAVADEPADVSLLVSIPDSVLAGGDGRGWLDATPWPPLYGAETRVTVSSVTDEKTITVGATTTTAPVAGQTRIAWWSSVDMAFTVRLVTSVSGTAGAYVLGLDAPLTSSDNSTVAAGDYICPAAANSTRYGETWRSVMEALGPGENTASTYRLPRAARHPLTTSEDSPNLNTAQLRALVNSHPEVLDVSYSYRSATGPTVPGSISTAPGVLVPRHFAIYPMS
jgi:uncharacterized phage protein gp47/JayE